MIDSPAVDRETPDASHALPSAVTHRPIRVCFLIDNLSRAGTETQLLALLRAFDRSRVEPSLVLLNGETAESRELAPDHCPVLRLGVASLFSRKAIGAAREFSRFLCRERVDVLQAYFLDSVYFGAPVAKLAGVRRVVRVRNNLGYWLTRRHRLLNRLCGTCVDVTLTNSEEGRAALVADGVDARRIAVLENGVDVDRFACVPPRFGEMIRIGTVANLRPVKGLDVLIQAASQLLHQRPDVCFEVAGDGPLRGELQSQIDAAGIGKHFRLIGAVADVPSFLASLDIAVLPSRSEGMSNAVLEYMAAGRTIAATSVGANPRLIRDGIDGLLAEPGDPVALAGAIDRLLSDVVGARRMGESARCRAIECFSRDAMRQRFEEFYWQMADPMRRR